MRADNLVNNIHCFELLHAQAQPLAVDFDGKCALHVAAIGGHTEAMSLLMQYADWLNPIDARGETPVHYAAYYG
jgi:ankyrin repeat protein